MDQGAHVSSAIVDGFTEEFSLEGFNSKGAKDDDCEMTVVENNDSLGMEVDGPPMTSHNIFVPQLKVRLNLREKKRDQTAIEESAKNLESSILVNQQHFRNLKKMSKKTRKDLRRAQRYETGETN